MILIVIKRSREEELGGIEDENSKTNRKRRDNINRARFLVVSEGKNWILKQHRVFPMFFILLKV